jgi:hypothetical protein
MYANENKVAHIARAIDELKTEIGAIRSDLVELAEILREVADRGYYADYRNWLSARASLGAELPVMNPEFAWHEFNFDHLFAPKTAPTKEAPAGAASKDVTFAATGLAEHGFGEVLKKHEDWIANPLMIYCGPGWTNLIERAFAEIAAIVRPLGQKVTIVQLQERMGSLCLRVLTAGLSDEIQSKLAHLTAGIAKRSRFICETCGTPGRMYRHPYRAVRCEKHAEEEARS